MRFMPVVVTRRRLLALTAALAASRFIANDTATALLEQVPPSASGITWKHENAMSEQRYLPETLGPGCAFFDFDNDGWMDIYLVNSGSTSTSRRRR